MGLHRNCGGRNVYPIGIHNGEQNAEQRRDEGVGADERSRRRIFGRRAFGFLHEGHCLSPDYHCSRNAALSAAAALLLGGVSYRRGNFPKHPDPPAPPPPPLTKSPNLSCPFVSRPCSS